MQPRAGRLARFRGSRAVALPLQPAAGRCPMDFLFVAATAVFFAVSLAYVRGCDRL